MAHNAAVDNMPKYIMFNVKLEVTARAYLGACACAHNVLFVGQMLAIVCGRTVKHLCPLLGTKKLDETLTVIKLRVQDRCPPFFHLGVRRPPRVP